MKNNNDMPDCTVDDVGEIDVRGLCAQVNAACDKFFRVRGIKYTDDDVGVYRALHNKGKNDETS